MYSFFRPICLPFDSLEMTNSMFSEYKLNTDKTLTVHIVCTLSISSSAWYTEKDIARL